MVQALLGLFSLRARERRDGRMGFKRNILTSVAACMWASALLAVFMGYNVKFLHGTWQSASGRAP